MTNKIYQEQRKLEYGQGKQAVDDNQMQVICYQHRCKLGSDMLFEALNNGRKLNNLVK